MSTSLCPWYGFLWGRCRDLRQRKMIHIFCMGSVVVAIKLTDQTLPIKIGLEISIKMFQYNLNIVNKSNSALMAVEYHGLVGGKLLKNSPILWLILTLMMPSEGSMFSLQKWATNMSGLSLSLCLRLLFKECMFHSN